MTGTEARSSERVAGGGRGVNRARHNGAPRSVGTRTPRLAGLLPAEGCAARAFFCLIGALAGGTTSAGHPNGDSQVVAFVVASFGFKKPHIQNIWVNGRHPPPGIFSDKRRAPTLFSIFCLSRRKGGTKVAFEKDLLAWGILYYSFMLC